MEVPSSGELTVYDTKTSGFAVRVRSSGVKTYMAMYRTSGGRRGSFRRYTIGPVGGSLSLEDARAEAGRILAEAKLGADPAKDKARKRTAKTVAELCDLYIAEGAETKKPSTLATDRGRIERHIKPRLGKMPVAEVTGTDVERFMKDIATGKTKADIKTKPRGRAIVTGGKGTAARTIGLLGGIFTFAMKRKMRPDNPVRGVDRYKDGKGERFLSVDELGKLGDALRKMDKKGANPKALAIIRALILTAARKTEIAALRWSELDLQRGFITLSDSKTGAKIIHLPAPAAALLAGIKRESGSPFVFPADEGEGHFQGTPKIWERVRAAAGLEDVRLHDLRHSFASVALARGASLSIIGKILGHADVKTTQRYAHLADHPVKSAADAAGGEIAAAMDGKKKKAALGKVVAFKHVRNN